MNVIKRDGRTEKLNVAKIDAFLEPVCAGLNISPAEIAYNAQLQFKDGMTTTDIHEAIMSSIKSFIDLDKPDAAYAAGRAEIYNDYHKVALDNNLPGNFKGVSIYERYSLKDYIKEHESRLHFKYDFDLDELNKLIVPDRDMLFTYLGYTTLRDKWLVTSPGRIELPQHAFMRMAMFAAMVEDEPMKWVKEFYDILSTLEFLPGTPSAKAAGRKNPNCFSCAVGSTPDNIEGIFDSYKIIALGSKNGTGWGYDWSRVRSDEGVIQGIPGASNGKVPFLKIANGVAVAVDQLGVRLGALNIAVAAWDKDIFDVVSMKRKGGEDRRTAEELFITVSCDDVFMSRVENNQDFVLFDPYDVPELTETYGDVFKEHYERYERGYYDGTIEFTNEPRVVNAKDVWKHIQRTFREVGNPFIFFKDNTNNYLQPNYDDVGLVRAPNLCMEYLSPIKDTEIPVCNLGSVNVARVPKERLAHVTYLATRYLDNINDATEYPIPHTEKTQMIRRSIGLGIVGEAELLANNKIIYGTEEHMEFIDELYGIFAKASDDASKSLGDEKGPCPLLDNGMRNYHRRCIAPTSTVAIVMGTSNAHLAVYDKVWVEENKLGVFKVTAPNVTTDNVAYYISAFDVCQHDNIRVMAVRQKHFDMGISHDVNFSPDDPKVTGKYIFDTYMLAWKLGLKTIYYFRSKSRKRLGEVRDRVGEIRCEGCEG